MNQKRSQFLSFVLNGRTSNGCHGMTSFLKYVTQTKQICCFYPILFWHHWFQYNVFSEIFAYPAYFKENSSRLDIDHNPPFSRICMLIQFIFYSQYFRSMGFFAAFTIQIIRSDVCAGGGGKTRIQKWVNLFLVLFFSSIYMLIQHSPGCGRHHHKTHGIRSEVALTLGWNWTIRDWSQAGLTIENSGRKAAASWIT